MKLPALAPALWFMVLTAGCGPARVKDPFLLDGGGFSDAARSGGTGGGTPAPTAGTGGGAMAGTGGTGGGAGGARPPDARPTPPVPPRPDAAPRPDTPPPPPEPDAGGGGNQALLFVIGSMAPVLSDMTMVKQLQDGGFEVTTRTDTAVRLADTEG